MRTARFAPRPPASMTRVAFAVLVLAAGCVPRAAVPLPSSPTTATRAVAPPASRPAALPAAPAAEEEEAAANQPALPEEIADGADDGTLDWDEEDEADDPQAPSADESEVHEIVSSLDGSIVRYSADLSDQELMERWRDFPEALGSISIGYADEGRLVNGIQFPEGEGWIVVNPQATYATQETIDYVIAAIRAARAQRPDVPPLRVNQASAPEGGYLRPHKSHQNGRDVDLGFYYPSVEPVRVREREKYIDVGGCWALLRAIVTETDVQMVLLDRRVQRVLYDHALRAGEDREWLDSIFRAGRNSVVRHARRHRDHFHVRFYNARAQELGRRVAPLLAMRPEQNLRMHRVRRGDTLGGIAMRYGTTVSALRKANRIRGSMLHISQVLTVPLRGPCTQCPVPPPVVLPERRLPPPQPAVGAGVTSSPPAEAALSPTVPATNSSTAASR